MTKNPRISFTVVLFFLLAVSGTFAQEINKTKESEKLISEATNSLGEKKYDEVIEKTSQVLSWFPKSGDVLFIRAMAYQEKGLREKAIEDLTSALTSGLNDGLVLMAHKFRGMLFYQTKKYDEAIRDFDFAISLDATDFRDFSFRGWSHYNKGNYNSAIADFDKVLSMNPDDEVALYYRGKSNYNLGNYQKAVEDINKSLEKNSKPPADSYLVRANAYRKLGKNDLAEADEKKYVELGGKLPEKSTKETSASSNEVDSRNLQIARLIESVKQSILEKNYISAFKDVDELIKLSPTNDSYTLKSLVFASRAANYFRSGEYEKSLADLNEAIKLDETSSIAYMGRAAVYKKMGKLKEAEADEQKSKELKAKEDEQENKSDGDNR